MTLVDVAIGAAMVAAAVGGWRLGFVTRIVSWAGMLVGVLVAVRLLPVVLEPMVGRDDVLPLVVTVGAVFGGALVGEVVGLAIGTRLRRRPAGGGDDDRAAVGEPGAEGGAGRTEAGIGTADGVAGAVAGVVGVLALVWLLLPVLGETSGWLGRSVRGSTVVQALDRRLPAPPDSAEALRDVIGEGPFPDVFESLRPTPDVGPPPPASGLDEVTARRVAASVVLVDGTACDRIQQGSGWVAGEDLVVTNAHVVAGEPATRVERDDGQRLPATVVAFDPRRDLAVLAVPGLDRPALPLVAADPGEVGGVFGHPGGGRLRIAPAEVSRELEATGRDIYGEPGADRRVLELAAALEPGDSGAPLVDPEGRVRGVVFAIATDRDEVAYALTAAEVEAVLAGGLSRATSTGACAAA